MSNSLNLIALHYDLTDFIDNRTPQQLHQCQRQQHPAPDHFDYTSHQSVNEYKQNYALPSYKALWSNSQLHEYSDPINEEDEPVLEYTRRKIDLKLSPGAISFYYRLATKYNMQPILYQPNPFPPKGRKPRCGINNYVSAALEAIGCNWLLLPDDYRTLIDENPNQNKNHVNTRKPAQSSTNAKLQGNRSHTPLMIDLKDSRWQPFTPARAAELRAEMIKNGEIPSDT